MLMVMMELQFEIYLNFEIQLVNLDLVYYLVLLLVVSLELFEQFQDDFELEVL